MNHFTLYQEDLPDNFNLKGDIAIDTETMGLDLFRDRLCLLQISNGDGNAYLVQFQNQKYHAPNLTKLILNQDIVKIFHFARFDLSVISYYLKIPLDDIKNIFCTKIGSKLTRTYTDRHGLKDLCRELLDINLSKQEQSSNWGSKNLTKQQEKYAANDVLYLHRIRDIIKSELQKLNRQKIADRLFNFLPTICQLDILGWSNSDIFSHNSS